MKMKLKLDEGTLAPSPSMRAVAYAAFDTVTRELGIDHYPDTLTIGFYPVVEGGAEGAVNILKYPWEISVAKRPPHEVIRTIAHELVHLKDIATGKLRIDNSGYEPRVYYDTKEIDQQDVVLAKQLNLEMMAMPYEREAYSKMHPLAMKVLDELTPELLEYVNKFEPNARKIYQEKHDIIMSKLNKGVL